MTFSLAYLIDMVSDILYDTLLPCTVKLLRGKFSLITGASPELTFDQFEA
jgi:hypothetical protein